MTPQQFLESKGVTDLEQPLQAATVELFLEEYAELHAVKIIMELSKKYDIK